MAFAGGGFMNWIDETFGFKKSGGGTTNVVANAGDLIGKAIKYIKDLKNIPKTIKNLVSELGKKFSSEFPGFKDAITAGINKMKDKFLEYVQSLISFGESSGGAGGPGDYQAMSKWIKGMVPGTTITSGYRPGDPGYHGKKLAVDMVFDDGSERKGGGKAKDAFELIDAAWRNSIAELIWDFSPWGKSEGIWNGKKHTFGGATSGPGTHADHIHLASTANSAFGNLAGVEKWRATVANVLSVIGVHSASNVNSVLEAIRQESSGKASTVNNWDSNAAAGTPSKGLMQVIQPTFDAYAGPYKSAGIFDPFANIYAAVKYAMSRYGGGWQAKITAPGGYRLGGAVAAASYDQGGMLQPGWTMAYNGTGRPEPVGHDLVEGHGDTYIFNFNGPVSDRQGAEDMVVRALTDAKKKGRI